MVRKDATDGQLPPPIRTGEGVVIDADTRHERITVGALLGAASRGDFDSVAELRREVGDDSAFLMPDLRLFWRTICAAVDDREPAIGAAVVDRLHAAKQNGPSATDALIECAELVRQCVNPATDGLHSARHVAKAARRRKMADRLHSLAGDAAVDLDVTDGLRGLLADAESSQSSGVIVRPFDEVDERPIRWAWHGYLEIGACNVIAGIQGRGKTFTTIDLAARMTTGRPWPDGTPSVQGDVLIYAGDDDAAITRRRLRAAGADLSRTHDIVGILNPGAAEPGALDITCNLSMLDPIVRKRQHVALILDPLDACIGTKIDANGDKIKVQDAIHRLRRWAGTHEICVIGVCHLNKSTTTDTAIFRVLGSTGFTSAARTVHLIDFDPADSDRRILAPAKVNNAKMPPARAFTLNESPDVAGCACVRWDDESVEMSADDLLAKRNPTQRDEAADFLIDALRDGPMEPAEVLRQADAAGFNRATVNKAKRKACVVSVRNRDDTGKTIGWRWACTKHTDSGAGE